MLWAWTEGSEGRAVAGPGADQSQPETLLSLGGRRVTGASQAMLLLLHAAGVDASPAETAAAVTG